MTQLMLHLISWHLLPSLLKLKVDCKIWAWKTLISQSEAEQGVAKIANKNANLQILLVLFWVNWRHFSTTASGSTFTAQPSGSEGPGTRCTLHCCRQGTYSQILSLGKCLEVITVRVSPGPGRARQRELREAWSYLRFVFSQIQWKLKWACVQVCACTHLSVHRRSPRAAKHLPRRGALLGWSDKRRTENEISKRFKRCSSEEQREERGALIAVCLAHKQVW